MNYIIHWEQFINYSMENGWLLIRKTDTGGFLFATPQGNIIGGSVRDDDLIAKIHNENCCEN
jgi:hypothetical protein